MSISKFILVAIIWLAVYLILFKKKWIAGFTVLGLAVVSKYFALIAFPFLVNAENRLKSLAVFIPLVLYLPFIDAGARLFNLWPNSETTFTTMIPLPL